MADAIRVLFDQATFWRSQYQPQKADEALAHVLALDPQNADALALQAQGMADAGNVEAAQKALRQLRAVRPDDPRVASIEQVLRAGPPDAGGLAEARRLGKLDRPAETLAAYRRAFHGGAPPAALMTEYLQALGASEGGWQPARSGLAAAIRANPDDLASQLAYAQLLTYRDQTRDEGLDRLGKLMAYPAIAQEAGSSYRKALFWLPSNPDSVPHFDVYLSRHPDDTEIAARETTARNDLNAVRLAGYAALQAGNSALAEAQFDRGLSVNPDDSDALLGLALTRFKQGRQAEGRALIRRVIAIDPTKQETFEKFLTEPPPQAAYRGGDPRQAARSGARIRAEYQRVTTMTRRGDYAGAEALLRRLMGRRPNVGNFLQLADIQASAGRSDDAVRSFRQALALQPRNALALAGLGRVLMQTGRFAEADALFTQAGQRSGSAEVARLRGEAYRIQAGSAADPGERVALLRQAVAADPANPWIRLELARALLSQGQAGQGQAVMDAVTGGRATSPQLLAGIYYANEAHNLQAAGALAAQLPERDRDLDIRAIQVRAAVERDLRDAHAAGGADAVRRRLFARAAEPDPTGVRVAAFGTDLLQRGDKAGARELVRVALAVRPPTPAQRLAYAAVLLGADRPGDAKLVAGRLRGLRLNPVQASTLSTVRDTIAVSAADGLNGRGKTNEALGELQPRLAVNPDDPGLTMALGRVYQARREPERALALNEALLQRNPSNIDVRRSTISAAMAAGEWRRANALAQETTALFPDDPQAWMISADVARARGQSGRALQDLRTARSLRQEQLRSASQSDARDVLPAQQSGAAERAGWRQYAQYFPANTANDASPAGPELLPIERPDAETDMGPDAVSREYARYAPAAGDSGEPGLDEPGTADAGVERALLQGVKPVSTLSTPPAVGLRAPEPLPIEPGVTAAYQPFDAPPFHNRFAAAPAPTEDEPRGDPNVLGQPAAMQPAIVPQQPGDPVLRDIDRSIAQVSTSVAPELDGTLSLRGRSGAAGLEQLFELSAPVEASYSPAGYGRLKVQVTPTYLYAGHISGQNLQRFGSNPLAFGQPQVSARNQSASGASLDVGYTYDDVSGDVGVTPLGFQQSNIVGGIAYAPRLTDTVILRVLADRRAVTDSLLSYGGTEDPRTGIRWGGVTRNRGHAQLEGGFGGTNVYAGVGFGVLAGNKVESNTETDAGAGFGTPVWADDTKEVRLGLDLVYFGFAKNLAGFTIGQGGYYSPQQFFAALIPINFRHQVTPDLVYHVGGSIGFQTFHDKGAKVFAGQSALQSDLVALASAANGLATRTSGTHQSGVAGGAHGDIDYRVINSLHIGAQAGLDRSGPFTEGTGLIYARYVFNDPELKQ